MGDSKFENNRNKFRRVYGYGGQIPPNIVTYTDNLTGLQKQADFNRIVRDHDMYSVGVLTLPNNVIFAEYQENTVNLTGVDSYSVIFATPFSSSPIITLQIDSANSNSVGFINYYVTSISPTSFSFGLSAGSTGSIHYKAINLPGGVYPASVIRAPLFPSVTAIASAGTLAVINSSSVTMSFSPVATQPPTEFSYTTVEAGNQQADTYISQSTLSSNNSTADLSQVFSGTVDFIAIK